MGRFVAKRIRLRGTLVAETPIHVGGAQDLPEVDLPLAIDGQGRYYVPGSSLAGPFRHWVEAAFGPDDGRRLFGFQDQRAADDLEGLRELGQAGFLVVEDAPVTPPGRGPERRDGVGIDRFSGTAAERIKFDRAVLPRGTQLALEFALDLAPDGGKGGERAQGVLRALIEALEAGEVWVGAAKTRGLGRLRLEGGYDLRLEDLSTAAGLLTALRCRGAATALKDLPAPPEQRPRPRLVVRIRWKAQGPVMVKAGLEGVGVDALPVVGGVAPDELAFVIPGSAIKGALRSQAERILRTVCGKDVGAKALFPDQLEDLPEVAHHLFGAPERRTTPAGASPGGDEPREQAGDGELSLGLGALAVADCYAEARLGPDPWRQLEGAADLRAATRILKGVRLVAGGGGPAAQAAPHVAIDRWTGGAAEALLFSTLELWGVPWEPIRLELDLARIPKDQQAAAVALLVLALTDLRRGLVPLGFAGNRGMGEAAVEQITLEARDLEHSGLEDGFGTGSLDEFVERFGETLRKAWEEVWRPWA